MRAAAALLSLCFWVDAAAQTGEVKGHVGRGAPQNDAELFRIVLMFLSDQKRRAPLVWTPSVQSLRVVGGTQASYGSHPWLVSLFPLFCFLQETNEL